MHGINSSSDQIDIECISLSLFDTSYITRNPKTKNVQSFDIERIVVNNYYFAHYYLGLYDNIFTVYYYLGKQPWKSIGDGHLPLRWFATVSDPFWPSTGQSCCRRAWWVCCSCSEDRRKVFWRRRFRTQTRTAWPTDRQWPRRIWRKWFSSLEKKSISKLKLTDYYKPTWDWHYTKLAQ